MDQKLKKFVVIALAIFPATIALAQRTEKITVSGNCGMCEKKIEAAAKDAGAKKADWDKKTKVLVVTYDPGKTSNDAIQKKIASVGYDTENVTAGMDAYENLHECCKYDNKRKPASETK